jgi:hypothetical protein
MLIHGTYHWQPTRIAFRADYCRSCQGSRLSVLIRTIDVLHIFWIPILPLGMWSRWFCTSCGQRPHQSTRTRRGFKVAGAIALALYSAVFWMSRPDADDRIVWLLRIVFPLLTFLLIASALRQPLEPDLQAQLAGVAEFQGWICPLCGGELIKVPNLHCTRCHADHRPLPRRQGLASSGPATRTRRPGLD